MAVAIKCFSIISRDIKFLGMLSRMDQLMQKLFIVLRQEITSPPRTGNFKLLARRSLT